VATDLDIDPSLLNEAVAIGHHRSEKAAVTEALEEYISHRKQLAILEVFGKIDYAEDYDYKAQRNRP